MKNSTRSQWRTQSGFTIVETLIVVAVSSALLVSAVLLVADKQRKVEFNQAAQDIQAVIQQVASETSAGHYPSGNNISCTISGGAPVIVNGVTAQGSNTDCIFLGRAIQFGNAGAKDAYIIHTIAGYQRNNGSMVTAAPRAINLDSARTVGMARNGLEAVAMRYVDISGTEPISGVAFLQGLGQVDTNSNYISGSQQATVVPLRNSATTGTNNTLLLVTSINTQIGTTPAPPVNPSGGVQICFKGGTDLWAQITIASNGRALSVTLDYKSAVCW